MLIGKEVLLLDGRFLGQLYAPAYPGQMILASDPS